MLQHELSPEAGVPHSSRRLKHNIVPIPLISVRLLPPDNAATGQVQWGSTYFGLVPISDRHFRTAHHKCDLITLEYRRNRRGKPLPQHNIGFKDLDESVVSCSLTLKTGGKTSIVMLLSPSANMAVTQKETWTPELELRTLRHLQFGWTSIKTHLEALSKQQKSSILKLHWSSWIAANLSDGGIGTHG